MSHLKRGADLIAEGLAKAGVGTIFTLSGNQIMPIFDAMIEVGIRLIHVRHEAAAVFMADAWAQLNNEIGVALITAAPGFANGLAPLYSAVCAESSVLLLSGDSPLSQDGRGAFQELDQIKISTPLTKLSLRATKIETLPSDLHKAIRVATTGRPGPVHLAFPQDILQKTINFSELPQLTERAAQPEDIPETLITQIRSKLEQAERPLILVGPALSASRSGNLHQQLVENLSTPVISMESPRGLKDPALGNFSSILAEADLVLSLGKRLDHTLNFAQTPPFSPNCRFLVMDADEALLKRAKQTLRRRALLREQVENMKGVAHCLAQGSPPLSVHRELWLNQVKATIAARGPVSPEPPASGFMHPAILCQAVQRFLSQSENPIFVGDGGEFGQWAQAYISAPKRIINGVSGAIGGGLSYALAAKASCPASTVVALMGDGTVGFHLSEFETAVRHQLPIIVVIGNDARWNAEVQIQIRDYGADRQIACELNETRYDLAVQGLGGYGEYVTDSLKIEAALQRAQESGLPACLNVRIEGLAAPSGRGP